MKRLNENISRLLLSIHYHSFMVVRKFYHNFICIHLVEDLVGGVPSSP